MKYLHYGIPKAEKVEGFNYTFVEKIGLHVTNSADHPLSLQFVYPEADSPLPEIVKKQPHISFAVEDIDKALRQFEQVAHGPVTVSDKLRICFAVADGVLFELMEIKG